MATAQLEKPWLLNIGCHRGTSTSRDSKTCRYDSLEKCKEAVIRAERSWASSGYYVWFARATGPDGKTVSLHEGTPYY